MTSTIIGCDLESIVDSATGGVAFDDLPFISVGDLLSSLIIQIHYNFV